MSDKQFVQLKAGGTSGRFTWTEDTSPGVEVIDYSARMVDAEPQAGDGGNFIVNKLTYNGGIINRPLDNYFAPYFHNYVCDAVRGRFSDLTSSLFTPSPDGPTAAAKVMAATNPSRPIVDCTIAAVELRDFPLLFRAQGDSLLKWMAQENLKYHFAWRPMVNDFVNLMGFGESVDNRVASLQKMRSNGGLRSRAKVGSYVAESTFNMYLQSVYRTIIGTMKKRTVEDVWGFMTWTPNSDFPKNSKAMRQLATKAVYGLLVDPATVWELLPWSWLTDWCVDIGGFFAATRNIIPATPSLVQVMRRKTTECTCPAVFDASDHLSMTGVNCGSISKERRTSAVFPTAHFPFLDNRKMSILGSIGLLNGGNRINR